MKRWFAALLCALLVLGQAPTAKAVGTCASSAVLMDGDSGRVLYEQNAHERRLIASITKLMTALVALESGHGLEELVEIRAEHTRAEGSSIYLKPGEQVTLETLLYGLMLQSGNDAALAVADWCGGGVDAFVEQMNQKAQELGMVDSHFANPNGLNAPEHYSTAYDMALLARACLENETLAAIVSTRSITLGTRTFTNHNKLLWRYEGCIGLKTGYTEKAGRTLVSAARRGETTLIAVTLNDPEDWADHAALLDYGFGSYRGMELVGQGEEVARLPAMGSLIPSCPILAQEGVSAALSDTEQAERRLKLDTVCLDAPLARGSRVGEVVFYLDGRELGRSPLVTGTELADNRAPAQSLWLRLRGQLGL